MERGAVTIGLETANVSTRDNREDLKMSVFNLNPEPCHKITRQMVHGSHEYYHTVMRTIEGVGADLVSRVSLERAIELGFDPDGDDYQVLDTPIPWEHIRRKMQ